MVRILTSPFRILLRRMVMAVSLIAELGRHLPSGNHVRRNEGRFGICCLNLSLSKMVGHISFLTTWANAVVVVTKGIISENEARELFNL